MNYEMAECMCVVWALLTLWAGANWAVMDLRDRRKHGIEPKLRWRIGRVVQNMKEWWLVNLLIVAPWPFIPAAWWDYVYRTGRLALQSEGLAEWLYLVGVIFYFCGCLIWIGIFLRTISKVFRRPSGLKIVAGR